MTSLFPELDGVKLQGYTQDNAKLHTLFRTWVDTLPNELSPKLTQDKVTVGKIIVDFSGDMTRSTKAMQDSKEKSLAEGKELFFVYPWDVERLQLIFSHFNSKLGLDTRKFAAKRLEAGRIPNKEADDFCKTNHIQGNARGAQKVSYGLKVKGTGELVAVQQYCKSRWMVKKVDENPGVWEGLRLTIKSGVQIHGAATKLQKLFLDEFSPTELMSYIDWSHSVGTYKRTQGFDADFTAQEAYMWCLIGEPNEIKIRDKDGELRTPELDKIRERPYLRPNVIAGAFGTGVGRLFYGGRKLGSRAQLKEQGNTNTYHNDLILEAIGYRKVPTAGQLRWRKFFTNATSEIVDSTPDTDAKE